jgi:hypothetical protein
VAAEMGGKFVNGADYVGRRVAGAGLERGHPPLDDIDAGIYPFG